MNVPVLFGPYGTSGLAQGEKLVLGGANACWFHGFNPSAFEACEKHGIAPCVEFKTFRADFAKRPELIPIGIDGKPIRYGKLVQGVCLSRRECLEEIEETLSANVREFRPTGIWLDYLTGAGWFEAAEPDLQESCFCPDCIAEFCDAAAVDAATPAQILEHHAPEWTRHKCERIARLALRYSQIIRSHLPECIVGAYMCPWTPQEHDGALTRIFGQDYELLAPAIDVFTPLIYVKKSGRPIGWGREFLEGASSFVPVRRKVQLILDILDFPDSLLAASAAGAPSWGLQVFGGGEIFSDPNSAQLFRNATEQMRRSL